LDRLWQKANKAGLEEEELILLKKEFQHHQDKVDQFHSLKELSVDSQNGNVRSNDLNLLMDDDGISEQNSLTGQSKFFYKLHIQLNFLNHFFFKSKN
jgi:hypothetical protein